MIQLTVSIHSDKQPQRKLSGFGMRRVNRAMGMRFRDITQKNFGMTGPYRAIPWPPYARNYPQWGKKKGSPATLIRTGRLMGSIHVRSDNDSYAEITSDSVPYADRQQFGYRQTPARPYYPLIAGAGLGSERLTPHAQKELELAAVREIELMLGST